MKNLAVIMALRDEGQAIIEDPRFAWKRIEAFGAEDQPGKGGESAFVSQRFPITFVFCGVGKAFASWSCARLLCGDLAGEGSGKAVDILLSLGTSGGLSSEKVGTLRLVKEFVEHDMDASGFGYPLGVTPSSGTRNPILGTLSAEGESLALKALSDSGLEADWARSASGDVFIQDAARARALAQSTGSSLCDMECAAIAKVCSLRANSQREKAGFGKLDYFAFRYISDNADHAAQTSWDDQVRYCSKAFDSYLYALAGLL